MSINKPYKAALKEKYINFCIESGGENIKISRTNMIKFICDTWYSENIITKDMIRKSFKITGLTNKLDHSEDCLFQAWSKMKEEVPLIDDDLQEDYNFDENSEVLDDDEDEI